MAFIVQGQTLVANANAYITVEFFDSYHADRANDVSAFDEAAKQAAIIRATDYLDQRFRFVGDRLEPGQPTEWPRLGAFDIDDDLVIGIPHEVQEATAEYALIGLSSALNPVPTRDPSGRILKERFEKVGPIEERVEFAQNSRFELPKYPPADRKLIVRGLVLRNTRIYRG